MAIGSFQDNRFDRRRLLKTAGAGLAGAAALGLVGCGDDDDETSSNGDGSTPASAATAASATAQPKRGGTWNRGAGGNISLASLPFQEAGTLAGGGNAAAAGLGLVWGQLVRMSETKLQWEPDHAKEWQVAADGKSMKFAIRDDIYFHSGRKFTTKDIAFGLDQLKNDKWKSAATAGLNPVAEYRIIDDYTMEWTFKQANSTIFEFMSLFRMVDMDTFDQAAQGKLIGTGAFKWVSFDPVRGATLEAYDKYHLGRPYLDKIQYTIFADAAALAIALETGVIDDSALSADEAVRFYDNKKFNAVKLRAVGTTPITFRTDLEPLQDKRVRQAIGFLLDRKRYQEENFVGKFDELGRLPFPSYSPAYDAELDKPIYDRARAKDLLKQAGFANGLPTPIKINTLPIRAYSPAIAQLLQQEGREVGLKFEFVPLEYAAMLDRFYQGKLDNLWIGFGDSGSQLSPMAQVRISATIGNDIIHHDTDPEWVAARNALSNGAATPADFKRFNQAYLDQAFQLPLSRGVGVNFEGPRVKIVRDFLGAPVYHKVSVA
ncbi:MAG: ABC transporter substrate-binding protein [Dehalococcoidia bacterium]|nr:ABC transporter substrate-binding protein [Dehalococcoidia bacterium]